MVISILLDVEIHFQGYAMIYTSFKKLTFVTVLFLASSASAMELQFGVMQNSATQEQQNQFVRTGMLNDGSQPFHYAAIFDGGSTCTVASLLRDQLIPNFLSKYLVDNAPYDEQKVFDSINRAFKRMNKAFVTQYRKDGSYGLSGAGALLILLFDKEQDLYIAHVGDCRVIDAKGETLTVPHNLNNPDEFERITPNIFQDGNKAYLVSDDGKYMKKVTRSFGHLRFKNNGMSAEPTIRKIKIDRLAQDRYQNCFMIAMTKEVYSMVPNKNVAKMSSGTLFTFRDVQLTAIKLFLAAYYGYFYNLVKDVNYGTTPRRQKRLIAAGNFLIAASPDRIASMGPEDARKLFEQYKKFVPYEQTALVLFLKKDAQT
jgi:serine/threonine protein phosphatase PrpC